MRPAESKTTRTSTKFGNLAMGLGIKQEERWKTKNEEQEESKERMRVKDGGVKGGKSEQERK
jgi:hypothetical protein